MRTRVALCAVLFIGLRPAYGEGVQPDTAGFGSPVVTPYRGVSGAEHGHTFANWLYEAVLSCNRDYGLRGFRVAMGGEVVARISRFSIDDGSNECVFDAFEFHEDKTEVTVTRGPGKISWSLSPTFAANRGVEYGGHVTYEARKISLTHVWTCRRQIKGRFSAGNLKLGIPLLTMCGFVATLADGTVVSDEIPSELPKEPTLLTPTEPGKAIASILFDTRKGKVRISFVPDQYLDMTQGNLLCLRTALHSHADKAPYRRYELTLSFPLGETLDVPRTYSVVFEFPD